VEDHVATVELTPEGDSTRVVYAVRTMPTVPLGGAIVVAVAKRAVGQLLGGVVEESERRASR
jgi:hypothetical protein